MVAAYRWSQSQGVRPGVPSIPGQRCLFRSVTVRFHCNAINMGFPQKPHLAAGVPTSSIHSALSSFPEVASINIDLHDYNCPVTDSDTFRSRKTLARLILDYSPKDDTVPATLMRFKDSFTDIEHLELIA
ncbi:hypothetical protein C8J57DRAFT_1518871 [Mycena rebaudengoi]|nr:hypothetical protein C8J57DRAFT_1518871 [Mycena rebaudengoi]